MRNDMPEWQIVSGSVDEYHADYVLSRPRQDGEVSGLAPAGRRISCGELEKQIESLCGVLPQPQRGESPGPNSDWWLSLLHLRTAIMDGGEITKVGYRAAMRWPIGSGEKGYRAIGYVRTDKLGPGKYHDVYEPVPSVAAIEERRGGD
jgi:hypothetical protein